MATDRTTWRAWLSDRLFLNLLYSAPPAADAEPAAAAASQTTAGSRWWALLSLMITPWPRKEDNRQGMGDWEARIASYNEWAAQQQQGDGDEDGDDEDGDDEADATPAAPAVRGEPSNSELTDEELYAKHPWLKE